MTEEYGPRFPESEFGLAPAAQAMRPRPRVWINILLFLLTILSTVFAGALQQGANPITNPFSLLWGLPFALALLAILLTHELGHYIVSRRRGVDATLPYFIPVPNLIGTFGAFIMMRGAVRNRRDLLDIGIAGPLAGFAVALPLVVLGLSLSRYEAMPAPEEGITLGSSLLFSFFSRLIFGPGAESGTIVLHPIAFAGWIGMLVTCLNLLPMGQLDGGHVAYAIFGRRHGTISILTAVALFLLALWPPWNPNGWPGWFVWALLPLLMKSRHPSPLDPITPLDDKRKILAGLALGILAVTFIPKPFSIF